MLLPPTVVCTDLTVNIDVNEMASVTAAQIAGASFDNCSGISLNIQSGQTSYDCSDIGMSYPVTVVVSDGAGNSASCTQNVSVEDPNSNCCAAPSAVCANTTVQLDASGNASITTADVDGGSTAECGLSSLSVTPSVFNCNNIGPNSVTLTVTDVNGDTDQCTATVTVEDMIAPTTSSCPADIISAFDADCQFTLIDYTVFTNWSDNCDATPTITQSPVQGTVVYGNTTVTVTATDDAGNTNTCTINLELQDQTGPANTNCPADIVSAFDADCQFTLIDYTVFTVWDDNCDATPTITQSPVQGTVVNSSTTVTVTATDDAGNTTNCYISLDLRDQTAPSLACPGTQTLDLDANCEASLADYTGLATVSDNCDSNPTVTQNPSPGTTIFGEDVTVVTLTATDAAGNSTACAFNVNTQDVTPPTVACLSNTVFLQPDGTYTLQDVDVLDFANSFDNCGNFFVTDISPAVVDCDDFDLTLPIAVTVSDDAGNTATCTAQINVQKGDALPDGWTEAAVGGAIGDAAFDPCEEIFCLESNGVGSPFADKEFTAFQTICGDAEITVRVLSVTNAGHAGIEFRESLAAGSKKANLRTQLTTFVRRAVRTQTNGFSIPQQIFRPQHKWLRLRRTGNIFRGYTSINGLNWQAAFTAVVPMNSCINVGLTADGINPVNTAEACFDNVTIIGGNHNGSALVDTPADTQEFELLDRSFKVFPNPATNEANIDLAQFENTAFTMNVYNNLGQLVYRNEYQYLEETIEKLDLTPYSPGMYLINIQTEDGQQYNKKLIVEKK